MLQQAANILRADGAIRNQRAAVLGLLLGVARAGKLLGFGEGSRDSWPWGFDIPHSEAGEAGDGHGAAPTVTQAGWEGWGVRGVLGAVGLVYWVTD